MHVAYYPQYVYENKIDNETMNTRDEMCQGPGLGNFLRDKVAARSWPETVEISELRSIAFDYFLFPYEHLIDNSFRLSKNGFVLEATGQLKL